MGARITLCACIQTLGVRTFYWPEQKWSKFFILINSAFYEQIKLMSGPIAPDKITRYNYWNTLKKTVNLMWYNFVMGKC